MEFPREFEVLEEGSRYTGNTPRHAVLKAARDLVDPGEDDATVLELYEPENGNVYLYDAWTWEEPRPDYQPDFLGDTITYADVRRKGIRLQD